MASPSPQKKKIQAYLDLDEYEALREFRHENRIDSMAEALREVIRRGLKQPPA